MSNKFPNAKDAMGIYEILARELHPIVKRLKDTVNGLATAYLGVNVTVEDLSTVIGDYDGQIAFAKGYSDTLLLGGGEFRWDEGSSETHDGGTIIGTTVHGRWIRQYDGDVWLRWFGATGDGSTDDYLALLSTYNAAAARGVNVQIGPGNFAFFTSLVMRPLSFPNGGSMGRIPNIIGSGVLASVVYCGVANDCLFSVDSTDDPDHNPFRGVLGPGFSNFTIRMVSGTTASTGIKLKTSYHCVIERMHFIGLSGNGIEIATNIGDLDSSIMTTIRDVRIDACLTWGIKADADSGFNESSFLRLENVFFQSNGTVSASTPPTSGGIIYKGQILSMQNCGFANANQNVGLYIPGQPGLCGNVHLQDVAFENCVKRSIYCTGVNVFRAENVQFYNNDAYVAHTSVEFDGSSRLVRNVQFEHVTLRATVGNNPHTAFKISGSNAEIDNCRIRYIDAQNFWFPGQIMFDGFKHSSVAIQCSLVFETSEVLRLTPTTPGAGNSMPLRDNRAIAGNTQTPTPTTGPWIESNIDTNGEGMSSTTTTLIEGGALAPSTRYAVYYWNNVGVRMIQCSADLPTLDSSGGYWVRNASGGASQLFVGFVTTTAAAAPNQRFSHVESYFSGYLSGSVIYDPGNLVDGDGVTTTLTVTGAALGDYAQATFSLDVQGITVTSWVSAANTVSVRLQNETGGAIDLGSGILRAAVRKA